MSGYKEIHLDHRYIQGDRHERPSGSAKQGRVEVEGRWLAEYELCVGGVGLSPENALAIQIGMGELSNTSDDDPLPNPVPAFNTDPPVINGFNSLPILWSWMNFIVEIESRKSWS